MRVWNTVHGKRPLFLFPAVFIHADASIKEVSVNDMISLILKQTEFTPENASHFPKMGGERD